MRKFLALAALVLGLASCQNEPEGLNVITGSEVDTVVTVTLPEAATRADWNDSAEGAFANVVNSDDYIVRYILQVYYNGETNTESRQVRYSNGNTVSFPVRLVPDRNYQFVVWADIVNETDGIEQSEEYSAEDDLHYNTADLANITLKGDWDAMDETRDAFTASETINFNAAQSINIPLYRPFAKLRVVTTDYDVLNNIGNRSIVAHNAKVVYTTKHRTTFNAYTSKAGAAYEVKSHEYTIKTYGNETALEGDHTIFSDYFFAENDVVCFDIEVYEANGTLIKKTSFPTDINVKRNYLTTLKGDVLTVGNNVGVTVVPGFGGTTDPDYNYNVVTSVNDLITAVNNGGNYKIGADLDIDSSLLPPTTLAATRGAEPKTTVIDFNGYTITVKNTGDKAIITVADGNTLVFEGEGSILLTSDSTESFIEGTVVLEGGEINNETQIPVVNGTVYENGGEVNDDVTTTATASAWLAEVCKNGGTFNLSEDLTINATTLIEATKPVVINGNDNTITFTVNRGFRITAANTVAFENVTIVNTADGGRCVETRAGDINLTFNNVNLTATKGAYTQPFTVGGTGENITVNFNNSTIEAGHYGITTFNPVALNINNSTISGYAALYTKAADGSKGSAGSVINVVNSTLAGINNAGQDESNSFSTVVTEDNDITINIDGNSKLVADAGKNAQSLFGIGTSLATKALNGCNIVVAVGAEIEFNEEKGSYVGIGPNQKYLYDNIVKFPAAYAANLEKEGWVVSEPVNGLVTILNTAVVSTADELVEALENNLSVKFANDIKIEPASMSNAYGKTGINVKHGQTIDGAGYTLNIKGAGGTWDSGINTTGGLIKNLTVTGSFRGIFINHTSDHSEKVVLENVTVGGNGTVYTISCDQGKYQTIEATNCTFNGWTSFAKTAGEAKFVNCNFGEGSGYKYCRPYSNTEFVGCTFCPGYAVDTTRATITFTDCTWEE